MSWRGITLARCVRRSYDAADTWIAPRRGADPAVFGALLAKLGHRRDRRHPLDRTVARSRRHQNPATASNQRNAAGGNLAVFGVERHGDRSAVHHARRRGGLRGDWWRVRPRAVIARAARRRT